MQKHKIGQSVCDATRPSLGRGVLQYWTHRREFRWMPAGLYAMVLFTDKRRLVFAPNLRHANYPGPRGPRPETLEKMRVAESFGLTLRQYRDAMAGR